MMDLGPKDIAGSWLQSQEHRAWLRAEAIRQLDFFANIPRSDEPGFHVLNFNGMPVDDGPQELHIATRLVHSYALGQAIEHPASGEMLDRGLSYIVNYHRDPRHGGYVWACDRYGITDDRKLA